MSKRRAEAPMIPHRPPTVSSYTIRSEWLIGPSRVQLMQLEQDQRATVRHLATGAVEIVPLAVLAPIVDAINPAPAIVERSSDEWTRAALIEKHVRRYFEAGETIEARIEAMNALGIADRTFRTKCKVWLNDPSPAGMMNRKIGRPVGSVPQEQREIKEEILRAVAVSPSISAKRLYQEFLYGGRLNCKIPSQATIGRLLNNIRSDLTNFSGQVGRELAYDNKPLRGVLSAERPLSVVEMDSTLVDVHIIHPHIEVPIGRPWLTLALDRYSRVILGVCLSLEPPSALSTALCLAHAVLPKDDWLQSLRIPTCIFPGYGLMQEFYTDNGAEFKNGALNDACAGYRIRHEFRPPGDPAKGGIIERHIGTFMGEVRLLPGASWSKELKRAPKDVDKSAKMTLAKLEVYLARAISRYHQTKHAGIDTLPLLRWNEGWSVNGKNSFPTTPSHPRNFFISLLPVVQYRSVTRGTVTIKGLTFRHDELEKIGQRCKVRFDPRDATRVYVQTASGFIEAGLVDQTMPSMSFFEWNAWRSQKDRQSKPPYPEQLAQDLQVMRDMREASAKRGVMRSARVHARQLAHDAVRPPKEPTKIVFARPLGRMPKTFVDGDE